MIKIAPSILSADFSKLGEEVKEAEKAGADLIHIDVMDGHFVPNITIGPLIVESIRKVSNLTLDVHLMIEEPDKFIEDFARAGADIISIHLEVSAHSHRSISYIKEQGIKAGISLNPATSLSSLDFILSEVDMVLLMSVNPGFGGQKFILQVMDKIKILKGIIQNKGYNIDIEVDGGVNVNNAGDITKAGADILVMGNAFFNSKNYAEVVKKVREQCG